MDFYEIMLQQKLAGGGGGGDISVESLSVTENGTYTASSGHAYNPINVSVPTGIFPSGTSSITSNGIYDITDFASVDVNVSGGGGGITADDIAMRTISGVVSGSATNIGSYAFFSCSALTTVSFPSVTIIGNYAFQDCSALTTVSFPSATNIGYHAFQNCSALTTVSFPSVTIIGYCAFQNCSALTTVSFPNATSIGTSAFYGCRALTTAVFLASSVAVLGNVSAFRSTPMSNSTYTGSFGSIYVPASLVSDYKVAANWSAFAARITAYEG